MPLAGRVGLDKFATGVILGPGASSVFIDFAPASLLADSIAPHGESPHKKATVVTASKTVIAEGRGIVGVGISTASCGHPCTTGSLTTQVGP